ncbi:MAG TPA: zf-HC2 domain-containing protein [Acidimicrobiales bacterium]|jgi:predicted anti-sigma-YlaC factor YlaD
MKLRSRPLVCREAVEFMSNYLEGALSRRDRRRLEYHLRHCDGCTNYLEQLRLVIATSGTASPDDLNADVVDGLVEVFRRVRDESPQ